MSSRFLQAYINDRLVGTLREENSLWAFDYDPDWSSDPDTFDLSPALPRSTPSHIDGGSVRPIQWYFDNLLPEESMRTMQADEAKVPAADAFGLLAYYGAESAGSLVLRSVDDIPLAEAGMRPLPDDVLAQRIHNLPRASLSKDAPKRMSLAGAQHKLLVIVKDEELFEPEAAAVSTHILKPNSQHKHYPATVINEYFIMRLATMLGLPVPNVTRRYTPEPVYLIERFDRKVFEDRTERIHAIDACQLLNLDRTYKYTVANLETLEKLIQLCRNKTLNRMRLFEWLVFNVLVGNDDSHLKNLSFLVSSDGIEKSPNYDMLCSAVYWTKALAPDNARWPDVELALSLPGAKFFSDVTRQVLVDAGEALGLSPSTAARELDRQLRHIEAAAEHLHELIDKENEALASRLRAQDREIEGRVLRTIRHGVIHDMVNQIRNG